MSAIICIILTAAINRLRGWKLAEDHKKGIAAKRGWNWFDVWDSDVPAWKFWFDKATSKYLCAAYIGLIWALYSSSLIVLAIVALGYAFWAAFGWGDYNDFSDKPNKEVKFIDVTAHLLFGWGAKADLFSGAIRGLFILPLFVGLAIYTGSYIPAFIGLAGASYGAVYYGFHRLLGGGSLYKWPLAEIVIGLILATQLWSSLCQ